MIFHWLKYKVPVERHSNEIIIRMLRDGVVSLVRERFWDYLKREFGVKQYFNWRNCTSYMVFDNEQHYLMFLLKL
jgi:hypothetical protein